jgi:hypothetical protein
MRERITFWIGIDPAGATDPNSGNIQLSNPATGTSGWTQISKQVTATSSTITLFLKAQKSGGASNAQFDDANVTEQYVPPPQPTISRSPATLSPSCDEGSDATSDSFTVSNGGDGTLEYAITDNVGWLSVSPTGGSSTGEADTITVNYTTSGLAAGIHNATITITEPDATNNPETISVTLTVNEVSSPFAPADFDEDGA